MNQAIKTIERERYSSVNKVLKGLQMKIFVAGATGVIGRPLLAQLLARGHNVVALTRSQERAQLLVAQGIEPAIRQSLRFANADESKQSKRDLNTQMKILGS
jgi:nucleoside-diphosphate-sugar epimerase